MYCLRRDDFLTQASSISIFNTGKGDNSIIQVAAAASVTTDGLGSCGINAAGQSRLPNSVGGSTVGTGGRPECGATSSPGCCSRTAPQPLFVGKNATDWVVLQPVQAWQETARISGEGTAVDIACTPSRPFARGGGRVWLSASTVQIDGTVSSSGQSPNTTTIPCNGRGNIGGASSGGTVIITASSINGAGGVAASGGVGMQASPGTCGLPVAAGGGGRILLQYDELGLVLKSVDAQGGAVPIPSGGGQSVSCLRGSPGVLVLAQAANTSRHNSGPSFVYTVSVVNDGGAQTLASTPININDNQNVASVSIGGTATVVSRQLSFRAGGYLDALPGASPTQGLLVSGAQLIPLSNALLETSAAIYGAPSGPPQVQLLPPAASSSSGDDGPPVAETSLNIITTDVSLAVSATLFSTGLGVYVHCRSFSLAAAGQIDTSGSVVVQAAQDVSLAGSVSAVPLVSSIITDDVPLGSFVLPEGTFVAAAGQSLTVATGASIAASFVGLWSDKNINIAGVVSSKSKKDTCMYPVTRRSCAELSWGAGSPEPVPPMNNYTMVLSAGAAGTLNILSATGSTNSGQVSSAAGLLCGQQVTIAGSLIADNLGCVGGTGPGKGQVGPGNGGEGGGGGHGGHGGRGSKGEAGGVPYDNTSFPQAVGSGGGGGTKGIVEAAAGGFLRIEAFEALNVLEGGVINASAAQLTAGQTGGGAAGGGVAIMTGNLTGGGNINALGSNGGPQSGGGGGGVVGIRMPFPDVILQGVYYAEHDTHVTSVSSAEVLHSLRKRALGESSLGRLPLTCGERTRLAVALGAVCAAHNGLPAALPVPRAVSFAHQRFASFELASSGFTARNFTGSVNVAGGQGQGGGEAGGNGSLSAPGCEAGYTALQCVPCAVGTYKDVRGVSPCRRCTNGPSQSTYVGIATTTSSCSYKCNPGFRPPHCLSPFDTFLDDLGFYHLLLIAIFAAVCLGGIVICALRCRGYGGKGAMDDAEAMQQAALLDFAAPSRSRPNRNADIGTPNNGFSKGGMHSSSAGSAQAGASSDVADRLWAQLGSQFGLPSANGASSSADKEGGLRTSLLSTGSQYGTASVPPSPDQDQRADPAPSPKAGVNIGRNVFCVSYRSVLQTRLALAPGDLKRHALRLYLAGSNSPGDPWHLHPLPRKDLQEYVDVAEWGAFVRKLNAALDWPSSSCGAWLLRVLHVVAPPAAGSLLTAWRAHRAHQLLRVVANSDCSFMLHSRELALADALRCTISGEYTVAALDLLAETPRGGTIAGQEQQPENQRPQLSLSKGIRVGPRLPLALLLAGRGSVNSPWYLDPNDTLTRSVPLATGVTTFIHNSWVDFVAEFNARCRVVQRSALNASLPPLLAYLQWVNATSALTAGRRGMGSAAAVASQEAASLNRFSHREDSSMSAHGPLSLRRLGSSNEDAGSVAGRASSQAHGGGAIHDSQAHDALLSSGHLGGIQLMLVRYWPTAQDSLTSFSLAGSAGATHADRLTESDFQLGVLVMLAPSTEAEARGGSLTQSRPRAVPSGRGAAAQPVPSASAAGTPSSASSSRRWLAESPPVRAEHMLEEQRVASHSRKASRAPRRTSSWRSERGAGATGEHLSVVVGSYGAAPGSSMQSSPMNRLVQQSIAKGYAMTSSSGLGPSTARRGQDTGAGSAAQQTAFGNSRAQLLAGGPGGALRRMTASPGGIDMVTAPRDDPPHMMGALHHSTPSGRHAAAAALGPLLAPDWGMDRSVPDAAFVPESRNPLVLLDEDGPTPSASARINGSESHRGRGATMDSVGSLLTDFGARTDEGNLRAAQNDSPPEPLPYLMVVGGSVLGRRVDMTLPLPGIVFSFEGCALPLPLPRWRDGYWYHPASAKAALAQESEAEELLEGTAIAGYESSQQAEQILLARSATPYLGRGRWLASLAAGSRLNSLDDARNSHLEQVLNAPIRDWEQPFEAISTALAGGPCLCVACAPVVLDESPQMAAVNCTRGHVCAWLGCGVPVFSERFDSTDGFAPSGRQSPMGGLYSSPVGAERDNTNHSRGPVMPSPALSHRSHAFARGGQRQTSSRVVLSSRQRAAVDTCAGYVSGCLMRAWMCFRCCLMRRALPWRITWPMYLLCILHVLLLVADVAGTGAMLISVACLSQPQINNAVTPSPAPEPVPPTPDQLQNLLCRDDDAALQVSHDAHAWQLPTLLHSPRWIPVASQVSKDRVWKHVVPQDLQCDWLEQEAALLGANASVLPTVYSTWAHLSTENPAPNSPDTHEPSSVHSSVTLPSSSGQCSSLLLVLALVIPPGAVALAPLLGLAAITCFSPTAWSAFRSYHVRSYVSVIVVAVGVSYYANSLAGYEKLLPAGVLLAKMGVSQTAPQVLAWLSARRPQAGWRGLHEVQLYGYAGEREWI